MRFELRACSTATTAVTRITEFHEVAGGSTGRKVTLSVEYGKRLQAGLHTDLFVKFSRDLDNPIRDRGKTQMEPEVRFASLSRVPGFPIAVPSVQFGDYHRRSGTGILITERIRHGDNGIERQYTSASTTKCPNPLITTARCSPRWPASQAPIDPGACRPG